MAAGDEDKGKPRAAAAYRLLAADELGVLRVVEVPEGPKWGEAAMVQKWGEANKEAAVCSLACSAADLAPGTPALVAVGRKGRRFEVLDAATGAQQASIAVAAPAAPPADRSASARAGVSALAFVPPAEGRPLRLVAAASDGVVTIASCSGSGGGSGGGASGGSWSVERSFQAGGSVTCMAVDAAASHLLIAGEGALPSLWELGSGAKVWQAKGGKPNRIGLVDKPYTTAVAFLPGGEDGGGEGDRGGGGGGGGGKEGGGEGGGAAVARRFVAGSASAKLALYDTAAGRRPQAEVAFGESRVTALAPEPTGLRVWAANGTGHVQVLDVRSGKLLDALKGAGGSVRTLALHPAEPLIASAGLDRFLRVHNTASRAALGRAYLKQQLAAACWLPTIAPAGAGGGSGGGGSGAEAAPAGSAAAADGAEPAPQGKPAKRKKGGSSGGGTTAAAGSAHAARSGKKRRGQPA